MQRRHLLLLKLELLLDVLVVIVVVRSSCLVRSLPAFLWALLVVALSGNLATLLGRGCLLGSSTSLLSLEFLQMLAVEKVSRSTKDGGSIEFVRMAGLMMLILGFPLGEMVTVKGFLEQ